MQFSIKEIIDIAIGIETYGYDFYMMCKEKFEDSRITDVFDFLAREELVHRDLFQSMHETVAEPSGQFTEEYYAYLKAIGGEHVFGEKRKNIKSVIEEINTPLDAVRKAFFDERNSIVFYSELKELYKDDTETTAVLERIIQEERRHVGTLVDLVETMNLAEQ